MTEFPLLADGLVRYADQPGFLLLPGIAQLLVRQELAACDTLIDQALNSGITSDEISETILQCYLFDGYPTTIEGLRLLRQRVPHDATKVHNTADRYHSISLNNWQQRGERLCRTVYGKNYHRLLEQVESLSPDLNAWFVVEGYGKVLSRPELDIRIRELIIIAILLWKQYPRQLHSHIHGAFNVGTAPDLIHLVIEIFARDQLLAEDALHWWKKYNAQL